MHVRVRCFGKPDTMILVKSKLTKIDQFKRIIKDKFNVQPKLQRLLYGGKLLENEYTFHDYNIKHNDVIQLMISVNEEKVNSNDKEDADNVKENNVLGTKNVEEKEQKLGKLDYKDAESRLYAVGDLVDMQDSELGSWHEGKIIGIYLDPARKISVIENEKSSEITTNTTPTKNRGIASYFCKSPVVQVNKRNGRITEDDLLFKVKMADEDKDDVFCKHKCIRPRARITVAIEDVKPGQTVMVNHNLDDPPEKGHWYDFKVEKVNKVRTGHELYGTIYLGAEGVPRDDTTIKVHDKIYVIEEVIPLSQRTEEYNKLMTTPTEIRPMPLNCLTCRDDEEAECQDCGCYLCLGKESPDKIILCDECNHGYHMSCLRPALQQLPEEDWYCPSCKRDPLAVVAPGASKQARRAHTQPGGRDWGRGMACVGKSKTCPMPANHFGPIPGIEVGMCWRFRIQLSESGVHRPPVSGIHGRDVEGAYSIVLSGGYEDDVDNGHEFIYTGSGGRNLSGNKRTAEQSCDQKLTRENRALARNCAVKGIAEEGGDAGDAWREGRPVRVVRSYKMMKHFPKYAPEEGIRYDGIYKVVKYYPEKGLSGYRVWKYLLRRDDPSPAPWEEGAKKFPIVYPDGYLEAEAEKKALKEKESKKGNKKRNKSPDSDTEPSKKRKLDKTPSGKKSKNSASPKKVASIFDMKSPKSAKKEGPVLSAEELAVMKADTLNAKLWDECIKICEEKDKKEFVEHVTQVFICIICQDVAVNPVTTPCLHNFCMACIKLAFKSCKSESCPACRQSLSGFASETNVPLRTALRTILTGYDAGK